MNIKWFLVDTVQKWTRAVEDIGKAAILSIDTEYDSFRYFKEKLCLLQIHACGTTYIFDPLNGFDLSFLGNFFHNRQILKILHAADNDIRLLKRDYSFDFENIFDTHRAALLLGFRQLSLDRMIAQFVGIELKKNKKVQRSRWDMRPLTDEQLNYAAQDVAYLSALYEKQLIRLREKSLENEALEAFSKIASCSWREKIIDRLGYTKVQGYKSLSQKQKEFFGSSISGDFAGRKKKIAPFLCFCPTKQCLSSHKTLITFMNV